MVKNIDANNFGLRIGMAWSPQDSGRLAIRAGYGIFYSPPSFSYLALEYFAPPFFVDTDTSGQPFSNPFASAPPVSSFPLIHPGSSIDSELIDGNARTPYVQQFNTSVQYELVRNTRLEIAYVGSRGVKLFRVVNTNQALIASLDHPIVNAVTGQVITVNTSENASLRAPMQGVSDSSFFLNETSAQSTYHSLQARLSRRFSRGLLFAVSYTFSKSIDNASNPGGGANTDGSVDRSGGLDTADVWGNQLKACGNRGISDFDRTHYFVLNYLWDVPVLTSTSKLLRLGFSSWQVSGIVTAMSGLPVDIVDSSGGSLYGQLGGRPNWALGTTRKTAMRNVPVGYYFNPAAFVEAAVEPGHPIPSANDATALAGDLGTDFGDVGRNALRGPSQTNLDFSLARHFPLTESRSVEFRADCFNVFNHANHDNPMSDITNPNFGKVLSFSSSPRIVQLGLKLTF